jgi:outer membrane protein OmpA-like peptidoglycan-associated protein
MSGLQRIGTMALVVSFMGTGFTKPVEAGLWPFASKKHIKKQIDPLTGRVSELEEINRQQEARIKDVDERAQKGIRSAMSKTEEADAKAQLADQKATEANRSALQANSNAKDAETRLQGRLSNLDNYQVAKTMQVNFKLNQVKLDEQSQSTLDELASELRDSKGYLLEVEGYADPSGSAQVNLELSRQRACSVVRYLSEKHEVPLFRMRTMGMGQAKPVEDENGKVSSKNSRRVEVRLLRTDTMVVASK